MVKICCVKGCQSINGDIEKISLFGVPSSSLFQEWEKVLSKVGVQLKKGHFVCEKHFNPCDVKKETIIKDATGKVIFQKNLKKRSLSDSAIPCIFGNKRLKRDSDDTENNSLHQGVTDNCDYFNECTTNSCISNIEGSNAKSSIIYECADETKATPVVNTHESNDGETDSLMRSQIVGMQTIDFFDYLYNTCYKVQFPSLAWNYHKTKSKNEIIFSEVKLRTDVAPIYQKQVVFSKNGEVKLFIYRKLFDFDILTPRSIQELNETLKMINALTLCEGGPACDIYYNIQSASAYKDDNDKWRHKLCTLIVSNGVVCQFCYRLHNTFRRRLDRNMYSNNQHIIHLPSKKRAINAFQKSKCV